MPTKNPVTRFGGFSGFGPTKPRVTNFGPYEGNPNAPKGSAAYNLWRDGYYDSRGNPHRPGDIALSPDLASKYRYGQIVTEQGVTGRFTDVTHGRLSNTVDVWQERPGPISSGKQSGRIPEPPLPVADGPGLPPSQDKPSIQISNADRPAVQVLRGPIPGEAVVDVNPSLSEIGRAPLPLEPSIEITPELTTRSPSMGRSVAFTTDPNEDWIGSDTPSNAAIAGSASLSPVNNPADYAGFASPTLSGETLRSLPNERWTPETEWWKQGTEMAGRDIGASTTFADAGGSIFDQHEGTGVPFETYTDTSTLTAEGAYPAPQPEPNFPEPQYPPPQPESPLPTTVYEAPAPDNQYVDTGPESNDFVRQNWYDESGFEDKGDTSVASRDVLGGSDQSTRPVPNLLSFGLGPFAGFGTGVKVAGGDVGGTQIDYGGRPIDLQPGEATLAEDSVKTGSGAGTNVVGSQGQVETGYGPMGELDFKGTKVSDPNTQWVKDPQLGWVPRAQAAPHGFQQLTPTQYAQQTFGGLTPTGYRDPSGSATFSSQAQNSQLMDWIALSAGSPNRVAVTETAEGQGHNLTFPGRGGARGTARSLLLTTAAGRARAGGRG